MTEAPKLDLLVFIMRGRIFHKGHEDVIDKALDKAHNVLVLIGSANISRNVKGNEFVAEEAVEMLRTVFPRDTERGGRLVTRLLSDHMHDEGDIFWMMGVQQAVAVESNDILKWRGTEGGKLRIGLIGYSKDRTSYYLKKFPQWENIDSGGFRHSNKIVSATDLREQFITDGNVNKIRDRIPEPVAHYLTEWAIRMPETLGSLRERRDFNIQYKEDHKFRCTDKYLPTHTTTDAVVIQSGHVLLIRRKLNPGKGQWALPGGFLKDTEYTRDGVIRELREETKLQLSTSVLRLAFRFKLVFSDPYRSERGRIITHAYLFLLNDRMDFPIVERMGADDADRAEWVPLGELNPSMMFEDHFFIIMKMLHMLPVD